MKVLIVDDDSLAASLTRKLLQSKGVLCKNAITGLDALKWLETEFFDLVLLDLLMPFMDGYETAKQIRNGLLESRNKSTIPILAYTSEFNLDVKKLCLSLGMSDAIPKYESNDKLFIAIKNLC